MAQRAHLETLDKNPGTAVLVCGHPSMSQGPATGRPYVRRIVCEAVSRAQVDL